jgi:ribosomal protein S18
MCWRMSEKCVSLLVTLAVFNEKYKIQSRNITIQKEKQQRLSTTSKECK